MEKCALTLQVEALFTEVSMQGCSHLDVEKDWGLPPERSVARQCYWDIGDIRNDMYGESACILDIS